MDDEISNSKLKVLFFLLIIPTILVGELIKMLHRVGPYKIQYTKLEPKGTYIRTKDNKNIFINYTDRSDKVVIAIHGYMSSSRRSYLKYADFLTQNDLDIIAFDFRNHGMSSLSLPISAGYYERYDIIAVLKWARAKWKKVHIIGTSMGAYSLVYALADQKDGILPDSVVLESFGTNLKVGTRNTLMEFYRFPQTLASIITSYAAVRSPVFFKRIIVDDIRSFQDKVPLIIAHGYHDRIYPAETLQELFKQKLKPGIIYLTVNGVGHSELWTKIWFLKSMLEFFNDN